MWRSKKTGIFLTYFYGQRLRDFPEALAGILDKDNVSYYDAVYQSTNGLYYLKAVTVTIELLLKVHSVNIIEQIRRTGDHKVA